MGHVWRMLVGSCVAALAASGCAQSDMTLLQGTWRGKELGGLGQGEAVMSISGNRVHFQGAVPKEWYKATFTLDEKASPRALVGVIEECSFNSANGKPVRAIYKIDGDTLTFAGNEPGAETRPSTFEKGGRARVFVLTRQKSP